MPDDLDLTILPLYRLNGQIMPSLPGLLAGSPPRRVARGRERDRLMIYLILSGNKSISTTEYLQMTTKAFEQFYQSAGSLTAAMRSAADVLNHVLLEANMRTTGSGHYIIGWLVLGALRRSQLYLLHSGPTHTFWMGPGETRHIFDPQLSGRGLGLSQTTSLYYSQVDLHPGDRVLFCGQVPPSWEKTLLADRTPSSLEVTRRRLIALADGDFHAALIRAKTGLGAVSVLKPDQIESAAKMEVIPPVDQSQLQPGMTETHLPEELNISPPTSTETRSDLIMPQDQPSAYAIPPQTEPEAPSVLEDTSPSVRTIPPPIPSIKSSTTSVLDEEPVIPDMGITTPRQPKRSRDAARQAAFTIASGMQAGQRMKEKILDGMRTLIPRLLPGVESGVPPTLSRPMMFLIAIAVPLIVVTIASMVYFRSGRGLEYQNYFTQAEMAAARTSGQADPIALRKAWEETLYYVTKAEEYQHTPQSQSLRQQAQSSLDALLGIVRLDFQPALSGFPQNVQISHMVANETDLYLLDAGKGNVLRASISSRGYQMDDTFNCAPGIYEGYQVGPLVDIAIIPKANAKNAAVMGIDASGNLLYCSPDSPAEAAPLAKPDTNWNQVTAFSMDENFLYVLDAPSRSVWIYTGQDSVFPDRQTFYFSGQVPALETVIDMTANGDDLYLLHADGHLATCSYSRLDTVPTRCIDPNPISDPHPAAQGSDTFAQARFTQVLFSPPPDSAVLLLDAVGKSIFRFSPRSLELQNQLRAFSGNSNPLPPGSLTAMTINPNHVLFLALGNQVYSAIDVP